MALDKRFFLLIFLLLIPIVVNLTWYRGSFNTPTLILTLVIALLILHQGYNYIKYRNKPRQEAEQEPDIVVYPSYTFPITLSLVDRVISQGEDSLIFVQPCTIQANDTISQALNRNGRCYFEIKLVDLENGANLYVGLASLNEDPNFIPGFVEGSAGIDAEEGKIYINGEVISWEDTISLRSGDCIGCLLSITGVIGSLKSYQITFIRNGTAVKSYKFTPKASHDGDLDLIPTLHATAPCHICFNFGQNDFLYRAANLNNMGISPRNNTVELPPSYGTNLEPNLTIPMYNNYSVNESAPDYTPAPSRA